MALLRLLWASPGWFRLIIRTSIVRTSDGAVTLAVPRHSFQEHGHGAGVGMGRAGEFGGGGWVGGEVGEDFEFRGGAEDAKGLEGAHKGIDVFSSPMAGHEVLQLEIGVKPPGRRRGLAHFNLFRALSTV